jgi:hypothetical protein
VGLELAPVDQHPVSAGFALQVTVNYAVVKRIVVLRQLHESGVVPRHKLRRQANVALRISPNGVYRPVQDNFSAAFTIFNNENITEFGVEWHALTLAKTELRIG